MKTHLCACCPRARKWLTFQRKVYVKANKRQPLKRALTFPQSFAVRTHEAADDVLLRLVEFVSQLKASRRHLAGDHACSHVVADVTATAVGHVFIDERPVEPPVRHRAEPFGLVVGLVVAELRKGNACVVLRRRVWDDFCDALGQKETLSSNL